MRRWRDDSREAVDVVLRCGMGFQADGRLKEEIRRVEVEKYIVGDEASE